VAAYSGASEAELLAYGEELWNDKSLSSNGLSCSFCHNGNNLLNASFAESYPHPVAMVEQQLGLAEIDIDGMVQFCLATPMATDPLPWDSKELAALV